MCPEELQTLIAQGVVSQVPPEEVDNKVLWTDGLVDHWLSARGQKIKEDFSPSMRDKHYAHGHGEPKLRSYGNRRCRILMGVTFYGKRPFYKYKNGKMYPGIAHHLINDLANYSKDNLLCWLTREEHRVADNRRCALETVVPNADLNGFDYAILRELQDPRTMTDADFDSRIEYLRFMVSCDFDPRIFNADDFHHFFSMPLEDFKTFFAKYKDPAAHLAPFHKKDSSLYYVV